MADQRDNEVSCTTYSQACANSSTISPDEKASSEDEIDTPGTSPERRQVIPPIGYLPGGSVPGPSPATANTNISLLSTLLSNYSSPGSSPVTDNSELARSPTISSDERISGRGYYWGTAPRREGGTHMARDFFIRPIGDEPRFYIHELSARQNSVVPNSPTFAPASPPASRPWIAATGNEHLFSNYTEDGHVHYFLPSLRDPRPMEKGELFHRSWRRQPYGQEIADADERKMSNGDERVQLPSFETLKQEVERFVAEQLERTEESIEESI